MKLSTAALLLALSSVRNRWLVNMETRIFIVENMEFKKVSWAQRHNSLSAVIATSATVDLLCIRALEFAFCAAFPWWVGRSHSFTTFNFRVSQGRRRTSTWHFELSPVLFHETIVSFLTNNNLVSTDYHRL